VVAAGGAVLRPDAGGSGSADEASRASMARSLACRRVACLSGECRADGAQSDRGAVNQGIELAASNLEVAKAGAHIVVCAGP
jgi:hypothetical protein